MPFCDFILTALLTPSPFLPSNPSVAGSFIVFGVALLTVGTLGVYFSLSYLGLYGSVVVGVGLLALTLASFLVAYPCVILKGQVINVTLFKWFMLGQSLSVNFSLYIDHISYSFALLTLSIALFVQAYAFAYFRYEPNTDRLIVFLNSFVASMVLLVLAGNLVVLFLGWELIGLTSFLLINFWSTRVGTLKAAFKAFSFNKVSDFFMFIVLVCAVLMFNTFDIPTILTAFPLISELRYENLFEAGLLNLFVFALLGAAFIKSAQLGGHVWLPDSMEAPAPASALIHSATLVSAGVFLILRFYPICQHTWFFHYALPWVGLTTAWYGGAVAYFQNDLKRILAYSTISHCGFLMALTTYGSIDHTLLYLYVHGFFKALAFLCVGNILRFSRGYQDLRRMGQFWKYLPFEAFALVLILLNLSGLPFFFGFYIKHLAVTGAALAWTGIPVSIVFIAATTGLLYSFKIIYYSFFDTKKARKSTYDEVNRPNLNRSYYTNSTLAAMWSITALLMLAYGLLTLMFSQKLSLSLPGLDVASAFFQSSAPGTTTTDKATLANAAVLNWVILMLASLLIFAKWDANFNSLEGVGRLSGVLVFSSFFGCFVGSFI